LLNVRVRILLGGRHCGSTVIGHTSAREGCGLHETIHDQSSCCYHEEKTRDTVWHPLSARPRPSVHR